MSSPDDQFSKVENLERGPKMGSPQIENGDSQLESSNTAREVSTFFEPTIKLVYETLNRVANHSWEWGTQTQVILEGFYPSLSVYSTNHMLPLSTQDGRLSSPNTLLKLLDRILANRNKTALPIIDGDGAAGDPASLGVAVMIAAATTSGSISKNYQMLADNQMKWLLNYVPRSPRGALSHRNSELQFWSDFIYMAPPFIAYYGAWSSNATLLRFAYDQARLYRGTLQDPNHKLWIWNHILKGALKIDYTPVFITRNGWAAAGMMRIYATFHNIRNKELRKQTQVWRENLAHWAAEIIIGAYEFQDPETGLLPNYLASNDTKHNYTECSGTAIIASAAYRLISLNSSYTSILPMSQIEKARVALLTKYTNPRTGAVAPVVDPLDWNSPKAFNGSKPETGFVSPEGQAFVLLLHESWKAYAQLLNTNTKNEDQQ
ncbi:hypothetical protein O181_033060 [Austropuccinia psidii MF-1]|uniref:Uncharacterized protein n=1 Tax=Austropuccinia psidii MF-1 TaxID=1389203 RepID=A0A9Q3H8U8_9BASI|nr:hypothetical protein [Austropuccinia psidii MF-1]